MSDFAEQEFDPSRRRLCPDGSCVGVIGDDGKCRECGRLDPDWTGERPSSTPAEAKPDISVPAPPKATPEFDAERRLCPDGACLGLLGPDGRCNICGLASSEYPRS